MPVWWRLHLSQHILLDYTWWPHLHDGEQPAFSKGEHANSRTVERNRPKPLTSIMKTKVLVGVAAALFLTTTALQAQTFTGIDLGTPALPGSVTSNPDGTKTIVGGGADIWGTADAGYYYYATISDPVWDAVVHVRDLQGPDWWTKCELMVRMPGPTGAPAANDPFIAAMTTRIAGQNQVAPQWRTARGGNADWNQFDQTVRPTYPGTWLRITRTGSLFTMWYGNDGVNWTKYVDIDTAKTDVVGSDNGTRFGTPWPDTVYVGVAVTAHNDSDMTGGVAVISDLKITSSPTPPNLVILQDVQDATAYVGTAALFSFSATNSAIPNGYVGSYQWYKNGTAVQGAVGNQFNFIASAADNGAKVYCKAFSGSASIQSREATLTVKPGATYTGYLKWEWFSGQSRANIEVGNCGPANRIMDITAFETITGYADNYASRVSGLFIPPETGKYVFFVAADDDADLFLSTDDSPSNKRLIAQETAWSPARTWVTSPASDINQKRSDWFTPDEGMTYPYQSGIDLVKGQSYYIEAVHHEGGGGDNLAVTFKLIDQPDPADGDAPKMTNGVISMLTWTPTKLDVATNPLDADMFEDQSVTFTAAFSTDAETLPKLQWQRQAPGSSDWVDIAGATIGSYTLTTRLADNGTKFRCVATIPYAGLTAASAPATLTVKAAPFITGLVKRELWGPNNSSVTRAQVEAGTAGLPNSTDYLNSFATTDFAENYVQRLSCYFVPPTTGDYVFFVCSDDDSDLFLSTNEDPANKRLIAQESGWSGARAWNSVGGGSTVSQKRSDQFSPDGGVTTPYASGIHLEAGKRYYIEAVHHEGTGGDNLAATYKLISEADPNDGDYTKLTGSVIGVKAPAPTRLDITVQPQDVVAHGWDQAIFTVDASTDALYPPTYQWRRNGTPIPGATAKTYSLVTCLSDNGAEFDCVVSLAGYATPAISRKAKLTVLGDAVFVPGTLKAERFSNQNRENVLAGRVGAPNLVEYYSTFEAPVDVADNYARRVSGFFIPAVTGNYVFFTCSDDDSDLYISTDDQPCNKRLVAQEQGWSPNRQWNVANGGSVDMKRSDRWSPDGGATVPWANGIRLEAGKRYYIEGVMHEGGGGDNFSATFKLIDDPDPENDTPSAFVAAVIGHMEPPAAQEIKFTKITVNANGTITVEWTGGGTLEATPSLDPGKVNWQPVPGATSPFTFAPTEKMLFGRIKK